MLPYRCGNDWNQSWTILPLKGPEKTYVKVRKKDGVELPRLGDKLHGAKRKNRKSSVWGVRVQWETED